MRKVSYTLLVISSLLFGSNTFCQSTEGLPHVQSIESKVQDHQSLRNNLEQLNAQIVALESSKNAKLQQMILELEQMKKQRDTEISEMKMGYFCSKCGVMKSEMEKKGETFEAHLKQVDGVPVPAGDDKIAAKRQEWTEKIALKTVQINNLKAKDEPAVAAKKEEISNAKKRMETICKEVTALSYSYEQAVVAEGKRHQKYWIDPAMSASASEHIVQDRIWIEEAKISKAKEDLLRNQMDLENKIRSETEGKQAALQSSIEIVRQQIEAYVVDLQTQTAVIEQSISEKEKIYTALASRPSSADSLASEMKNLKNQISALQQKLVDLDKSFTAKIEQQEQVINKKKDEIWQLTSGLKSRIDKETALLNKQTEATIQQLKLQKAQYEKALPLAHTKFLTLAAESRKKLLTFVSIIEMENSRMYAAASKINCYVSTAAQLAVSRNFNEEASCMEGLRNRDRSYPATSMDCASKSSAYMSTYRSYSSTLSRVEIDLIRTKTVSYWFESVYP